MIKWKQDLKSFMKKVLILKYSLALPIQINVIRVIGQLKILVRFSLFLLFSVTFIPSITYFIFIILIGISLLFIETALEAALSSTNLFFGVDFCDKEEAETVAGDTDEAEDEAENEAENEAEDEAANTE